MFLAFSDQTFGFDPAGADRSLIGWTSAGFGLDNDTNGGRSGYRRDAPCACLTYDWYSSRCAIEPFAAPTWTGLGGGACASTE